MSARRRSRPAISPSPELSSDEDLDDELENEDMEPINEEDGQGVFTEDEFDEEPANDVDQEDNDDLDLLESGSDIHDSEEEEEDEDEEEENRGRMKEEEEEEEEEEEAPKPTNTSQNKRKKEEEYDIFDDESDTEIVENRPLTKRQRAKLNEDDTEEYFMELPMDNGKKKTLTEEEEALRKSEVARRRKNQSIQRAEKDKDDTINRLLKKQASKSKRIINDDANDENGQSPAERLRRKEDPNRLHYVSNQHGSKLSIPAKFTVDQVFSQGSRSCKKAAVVCQVEGCKNLKKYVAKKSGKAVCSLEHYKVVEA